MRGECLQLEILAIIIPTIIALTTLMWYAGEFFLFKNYVQIVIMIHRIDDEYLEIIVHNNGNKSVRFDEFGIYILGTPIPIKEVKFEEYEISPMKPFKLTLPSELLQHTVDEKLTVANQNFKLFLREDFNEFRFYIKTANKLRLTKIWFSIEDIFPKTGNGLRDNAIITFNEKIHHRPVDNRLEIIYSTVLVFMVWFLFLMIIEPYLEIRMLFFLMIVVLPAILIGPITFSRTKRGLWAKRHTRILIVALTILTLLFGVIFYFLLDPSENMEIIFLFMFVLVLYPPVFMSLNYSHSVSLKSAIKKYHSKKYDFEQLIDDNKESDSQ